MIDLEKKLRSAQDKAGRSFKEPGSDSDRSSITPKSGMARTPSPQKTAESPRLRGIAKSAKEKLLTQQVKKLEGLVRDTDENLKVLCDPKRRFLTPCDAPCLERVIRDAMSNPTSNPAGLCGPCFAQAANLELETTTEERDNLLNLLNKTDDDRLQAPKQNCLFVSPLHRNF